MLNKLWAGMIIVGMIYGAWNGKMPELTNAALDSAKEAVTLCIAMTGVMAFWTGLMEIAAQAGVIQSLAAKMKPLIRYLFPDLPPGHRAEEHISVNFIANVLGLGWAATPAGLRAMQELGNLEEERRRSAGKSGRSQNERFTGGSGVPKMRVAGSQGGTASNEMCTFLIMNISSLQLIPVNIIAYRSQYGSVDPTAIVGAAIAATVVSTGTAILFCRLCYRCSGLTGKRKYDNICVK